MEATGIARKVDELGRIVIPMELRRSMEIEAKDGLEICVDGDRIILRKYEPSCSCVFCGNTNDVINFKGKNICQECLSAMSQNAI